MRAANGKVGEGQAASIKQQRFVADRRNWLALLDVQLKKEFVLVFVIEECDQPTR
jgi:hypothetical protein